MGHGLVQIPEHVDMACQHRDQMPAIPCSLGKQSKTQFSSYPKPNSKPLFSFTPNSKKLLQYLSHRMFAARVWSIKCRRKEKLIAQFGGKLRDERFEPN